jgi:dephospho-CoA kinase
MLVYGLTGSIGMGKTTAAKMLRRMGCAVCDSDAVVHQLFARGGAAVKPVEAAFPGVVTTDGAIDRAALGARVFGDPVALRRLEGLVHPLVQAAQRRFLRHAAARGCKTAVLDIPLLYETQAEKRVGAVLVVSAPAFLQRQRVLRRPGMTAQKLRAVLARQMPDHQKRRRADVVIPSGLGKAVTWRALRRALRLLREKKQDA